MPALLRVGTHHHAQTLMYGTLQKETRMDKDRIKGMADQAKGAVKDATGKVTGDTKLQAEGKMDKVKGKVENAVGGTRDAVRESRN